MKKSDTIRAAWIGFWGLLIAAIIAGLFMILIKHYNSSKTTHETSLPTESKPIQSIAQDKPTTEPSKANTQGDHIDQKTEGNQSPAIVSDGDVKIEYGGNK